MLVPTEAIILAGGLGSRLRSVVSDLPKPMAPVQGRPFLEHLMDYWIDQGIQHFVLSVGYFGERIEAHFGNVYRGRSVSYVHEIFPLGTGGGVRQVLIQTKWKQAYAVLINGDTWYEVSLPQLITDAGPAALPVTIALKPVPLSDRYSGVGIDSTNRVTEFDIKTTGQCLINGGCYLLDIKAVSSCLRDYPDRFSLERDFLVPLSKEGKVAASVQDATFLDIGIPADYIQAPNVLR